MTQMPPSLHTSVKSGRSNSHIEATTMSDVLEPWSHPWHALQRTLAKVAGADAVAYLPAGGRSAAAGKRATDTANWLVRAHSAPAPVFSTPR